MTWIVYILRLRDNSLYCGITNDYPKRLRTHQAKKGSKYVASRLPILSSKMVMEFDCKDGKIEAARLERRIKSLTKSEKERWMSSDFPRQAYLAELASDE